MQTVQNISDIEYFTQQFELVDPSYDYQISWSKYNIKGIYNTLPTFVADFSNCSVNSLPVLVTEDRKLITTHVWPLISKYKDKPNNERLKIIIDDILNTGHIQKDDLTIVVIDNKN